MSQTVEREQRRSALDEFAAAARTEPAVMPALVQTALPQPTGAQSVAVHRDESRVLVRLKELAAAAGSDWFYRFPVKNRKENRTDWIEGPSIKLANDLARVYGNCEIDCRAQDFGDTWLFHARFIDLETGFALTRPFQQRKSGGRIGGADDERRLDIAFQIGASKAIRNVTVNALQTFADFAFEEAREALVDRIGKDLERWRQRTLDRLAERHVAVERVEAVLGRTAREWLAPDVARTIAMMKAVSDGMASIEDTFPPLKAAEPAATAALDAFASAPAAGVVSQAAEPEAPPADPGDDGSSAVPPPDAAADPDLSAPVRKAVAKAVAKAVVDKIMEDPASSNEEIAAAGDQAIAAASRADAIERLLKLATDKTTTEQQKREILDGMKPVYEDGQGADFVKAAFPIVERVITGDLPPAAAKKFLGQLKS